MISHGIWRYCLRTAFSLKKREPRVTKGRCRAVIALTKVQSHKIQSREQQVWWWQWGSANNPGVARKICGGETSACPSCESKSVSQDQVWITGVYGQAWPRTLGRDQVKEQGIESSFWERRVRATPSYSFFSCNSFLNNLNHDYAAALCLWCLENRQRNPLEQGSEAALKVLVNASLQAFSYLRFCSFFHRLCCFLLKHIKVQISSIMSCL